jgi:carboxylesterase
MGFHDWVTSVQPTFDKLRSRGPVILVGLSLGSLIATKLAISAPGDVAGIALLANAFWLHSPYPAVALDLADRLNLPNISIPKGPSDLGDLEARSSQVSYQVQPLKAAIEVLRAGEQLRKELHRLHCPSLIVHGARDRVCPVENSWKAAERIGTRDLRVVVLPRSHHILTRDVERETVSRELREFMLRICPTSRNASDPKNAANLETPQV